jgi:catalase
VLGAVGSVFFGISVRSKTAAQVLTNSNLALPQRLIGAFDAAFKGPHPGFRANHAKGLICSGTFAPADGARKISSAAHFLMPSEALVRFSDFGGYPNVADNVAGASPYGMAVKFKIGDTIETDVVGHSVPRFPTATAEEFVGFLHALGGGGTTLQPFLDKNPKALDFVKSLRSGPASYATMSYHFINAFVFVNAQGVRRAVRYEMRAREPVVFLEPTIANSKPPDYLHQEIQARLSRSPIVFDYLAHIADPSDVTSDPTNYWPSERQTIALGTLTIRSLEPSSDVLQRTTLFDPARLTPGIELSDDPMVTVRSQSYAISFSRRNT